MKKLLALVLALIIALPAFALAETAEEEDLYPAETMGEGWDMMSEDFQDYVEQGEFAVLENTGLKMWIPNVLEKVEAEEGILFAYFGGEEDAQFGCKVWAEEIPEDVDMTDDYAVMAFFEAKADPHSVYWHDMNGLGCIEYTMGEGAQGVVSFIAEDGRVFTFCFEPLSLMYSVYDVAVYITLMIYSIQPAEA